jgi:thiol:disulfide interchange protein
MRRAHAVIAFRLVTRILHSSVRSASFGVSSLSLAFALGALASCSPSAPAAEQRRVDPTPPQLIAAPAKPSEVAPIIAAELKKARAQHATLIVYVGASWCEPCRRFHDALGAGELDATLPNLQFLEFDYDQSRDALARAGYVSTLIPLFAIPKEDGTASERRIEGSIKGPAAVVQNLVPRLQAMLADPLKSR